jgi:hypothetical protein
MTEAAELKRGGAFFMRRLSGQYRSCTLTPEKGWVQRQVHFISSLAFRRVLT